MFLTSMAFMFFQSDLVAPWAVHQTQFGSTLTLNNLTENPAEVFLEAWRTELEQPNYASTNLQLAPFEQISPNVADLFPSLGQGKGFLIRVTSDSDFISGALVVFGTGSVSGNSPAQVNLVPRSSAATRLIFNALPSDPLVSAVVLANMGEDLAKVMVKAVQDGAEVAYSELSLATNRPLATTTSSLFPHLKGPFYLVVESSEPVLGTTFIFNPYLEPSMAHATPIETEINPPSFRSAQAGQTTTLLDVGFGGLDCMLVSLEGNLLVSVIDGAKSKLLTVHPETGEILHERPNGNGSFGMNYNSHGDLFLARWEEKQVVRIDAEGTESLYSQGVDHPTMVIFDEFDNMYVTNYFFRTVDRVLPDGTRSLFSRHSEYLGPHGMIIDETKTLYLANFDDGKLFRLDHDGVATKIGQLPSQSIMGYLSYQDGSFYATSASINQIHRMSKSGDIQLFAGSGMATQTDGPGLEASFGGINGIAIDPVRHMVFVNHDTRIRTIKMIPQTE